MTDIVPGFMEQVLNKVVSECEDMAAAGEADGGLADIVDTQAVFFGDPGLIASPDYPCFLVEPLRGSDNGGSTRDDFRDLTVVVTYLIDARDYFERSPDEALADRQLVRVADRVEAWFRKKGNLLLTPLTGIRSVKVSDTEYIPQPRGSVFAKSAQITLTVSRSRQRVA